MKRLTIGIIALVLIGCVPEKQLFDTLKISFVEVQPAAPASPAKEEPGKPVLPAGITPPEKMEVAKTEEKIPVPEKDKEASPPVGPVEKERKSIPEQKPEMTDKVPHEVTGPLMLKKGEYEVNEVIKIEPSGTLILVPGTKLTFFECGIVCRGTLQAEGTKEEPIHFSGPDGWDNVTIIGEKARASLKHCHISDCLGIDITLEKNTRCVLKKSGLTVGAVLFANQCQGTMTHCRIFNNHPKASVALIGAEKVEISHNEIYDNKEDGLLCNEGTPQIIENRIYKNRTYGIICTGLARPVIRKNTIKENGAIGISLRDAAAPVIEGNTIESNTFAMEYLGLSHGNLKDNVIQSNQMLGIRCMGDTKPVMENNQISSNGELAFFIYGNSSPSIKGCKISRHKKAGFMVIERCSPTIEGNEISETEVGIVISSEAKPTIKGNRFVQCGQETVVKEAGAFRTNK